MLSNPSLSSKQFELRAVALQILGEAFARVRKDGEPGAEGEAEYVRIETKASRERERRSSRA